MSFGKVRKRGLFPTLKLEFATIGFTRVPVNAARFVRSRQRVSYREPHDDIRNDTHPCLNSDRAG